MPLNGQEQELQDKQDRIDVQDKEISDLQDQIEFSKVELPLLRISENILMVPLIGTLDSVSSQKVMEDILFYIKQQATKVVILDIAGITVVDSSVAAHLIKIAKATKLMGCQSIMSGISPVIAQNIVNLGIDVSNIETTNTLQDSMARAYNLVGYEIVKIK